MNQIAKPELVRLGWIEAGHEAGTHNIGVIDQPWTDKNWNEYRSICAIAPSFRPRVIDLISAEREASALIASPDGYARELDKVPHPMLIGGLEATLGLAVVQTALTNYLAASSAFIYRAERYLSKTFGGKDSAQFQRFKTATNQEYDSVFAYRLFRNMRNYSQHRAIPVSDLQISANMDDGSHLSFKVDKVAINRQELLDALVEEKSQKTFREELASLTDTSYDLVLMAQSDLKCLQRLFVELFKFHIDEFAEMARYEIAVKRLVSKHAPTGVTPVIFEGELRPEGAKPHLFGFEELTYLSTIIWRIAPEEAIGPVKA